MQIISTQIEVGLKEIQTSSPEEIETLISKKISTDLIEQSQKTMTDIYTLDGEFNEESQTMIFKSNILITTSDDFEKKIEIIFKEMTEYMSEEEASRICELLAE